MHTVETGTKCETLCDTLEIYTSSFKILFCTGGKYGAECFNKL